MKLTLILVLCISADMANAQYSDSLVTGKKYKITLFDEREITGTIVSQNEKSVSIKSGYIQKISKENILITSRDISPTHYKYLLTANGGFIPGGEYNNFIINGRFLYFIADNKNVGLDVSYVHVQNYSYYSFASGIPYIRSSRNLLNIIINAQLGTFSKSSFADLYLTIGAGLQTYFRGPSVSEYYSFGDSSFHAYDIASSIRFNPLVSAGGGVTLKPRYNFGINLEASLEMNDFDYVILPVGAYLQLKAGISYYFMK